MSNVPRTAMPGPRYGLSRSCWAVRAMRIFPPQLTLRSSGVHSSQGCVHELS